MPSKDYYDLVSTDYIDLSDEERMRKLFCEALPDSVVAALAVRAEKIRDEVMRLEKERDEIIDFLNGYGWRDFCPPFEYPAKDGDDE